MTMKFAIWDRELGGSEAARQLAPAVPADLALTKKLADPSCAVTLSVESEHDHPALAGHSFTVEELQEFAENV
ncbi:MAG: hypothetical protein AAGE90_18990 [Pseudomonadota bacterium]